MSAEQTPSNDVLAERIIGLDARVDHRFIALDTRLMDKSRIFTKEDWLEACAKLLPNLTDAEREALYDDAFPVENDGP